MKYCEDNFSKWVIIVAVFLGVFSFSGYNNNPAIINNAKAKTELVHPVKTKNKKFTVAFEKVTSPSPRQTFLSYFSNHSATLLLTSNKLIKVKFDNISKLSKSIVQPEKFVQVKNIPSNSSEDIFISIG